MFFVVLIKGMHIISGKSKKKKKEREGKKKKPTEQ